MTMSENVAKLDARAHVRLGSEADLAVKHRDVCF